MTLDEAWAEAEAALPEGWQPENGGTGIDVLRRNAIGGWIAWAESGHYGRDVRLLDNDASERVGQPVYRLTNVAYGEGATPAAALHALAEQLAARVAGEAREP